jgi:hypothetical protein
MPHFKNLNNELFWLDEDIDSAVWLPNCTRITDAEAEYIRVEKSQAIINAMTYADKRAAEYPSFADQFDLLYHGGYDAWKNVIQTIKTKYPKPE